MKISKGIVNKPALLMVYGPDGIGKSSFGAEAPHPIFVGPEAGSNDLNVERFDDLKSFDDIKNAIKWLLINEHTYQTVVLDSVDWLEPLLWKYVCDIDPKKPEVIEEAFGGYGKGFTKANIIWKELMTDLQALRDKKNMNVIAIAHSQVKTFNDPSQPLPYDRYMLKLNEKAAALWREFVDCVLFANFEVVVKKDSKNDKKGKAYGEDVRLMYSHRRPSFDAKNRYGLPFELPLGWKHFEAARGAGITAPLEELLEDLADLSTMMPEDKRAAMISAVENANNDQAKLLRIRNHARALTKN